MEAKGLIAHLEGICGREAVVTHEHQLRTYESDGLLMYRSRPLAAVIPETAEQVRDIVRVCAEAEVPWVARGSGTGLSGGALPHAEGVLLVLSRLRRILEVDLPNQRVVVEPGVTNLEVSKAVAPTHFYPPDPSSQVICSIGGNVAENSGGAHCFKYGFTTNYVTGLEIVLADGEVVELGGKELDPPGYDLLGTFVGSEGTLGVATRITLRVVPVPEAIRTLVAFYDSTPAAGEAVERIVAGGILPGAIEIMDRPSIQAAEAATNAGYRLDAGAALLVELDGPEVVCEELVREVEAICAATGAMEVRVASEAAERAMLWKARKATFGAMGRIAKNYYVQDSVVPRTKLAEVLALIDELADDYGLLVANVFHAGDGNLHPLVCYDGSKEGEAARAEELAGLIVKACVDAGGSITGEHGVGVDKKRYMPQMFGEDDLEAFQRLRCAFDPAGLANPGKVMPTPRLCGEVPGPYREHPRTRRGGRAILTVRREIPQDYAAAAEGLREAGEEGHTVRIVGGGTKLDPESAPADVELSTAGLDAILEHNAGDLTAILQAGVPLARAQEVFAEQGQMLALDPPDGGATIGGVVATADSGPSGTGTGGVRDLVIGATIALTDGTVARSGGKVIKNVADYDLAKLVAGSRGTLGAILEVAVRLHPIPRARATAVFEPANADELGRKLLELTHAPLELESLDVRREGRRATLLARFAGVRAVERAEQAMGRVVEADDELWAHQREAQHGAVRVSALQTDWPRLLRVGDRAGRTLVGRGALGLAWIAGVDETAVRAAFPKRRQSAAEAELMRRVRARFDVHGALVS